MNTAERISDSTQLEQAEDLHRRLANQVSTAYQAVQTIEATTRNFGQVPLPAPMVYDLLADLKSIGYVLGHALTRIAADLNASHRAYDLFNDDGTDPTDTLDNAADLFAAATVHAHGIGRALEDAQAELSTQGYRITKPSRATQPENGDPWS